MSERIKVGLFLSNQQPPDRDPVEALDEQLRMVAHVRDAGWDSIFTGQHYLLGEVRKLQPIPFIARLCAESGDMRVGIAILLLSLQNPVDIAESMASLDVVSLGKLIIGSGLGYRQEEFDAFGIPRSERVPRFEENLRIVTRLLEGDEVTADLPWCKLNGARLVNRPVQDPRPPLWIGANNDRAIARAATMGDTWMVNPHARFDTVRDQLEMFRATRRDAGLPQEPDELPIIKEVFCAETRQDAFEQCLPYLGEKYRHYLSWGQDGAMPTGDSLDLPIDQLVDQRFVVGTPQDCLDTLSTWRDQVGANHFVLRTEWVGMPPEDARRSLRLLTEEVIPALKAGSTTPGSPAS